MHANAVVASDYIDRVKNSSEIDIKAINDHQRLLLLQELKTLLSERPSRSITESAYQVLFDLRDENTISNVVKKYKASGEFQSLLQQHGNGIVVANLGDDLYLPEHLGETQGSDFLVPSRRFRAANIIVLCIYNSDDFPSETKAWISDKTIFWSGDNWPLIYPWWEHNKNAILARRFKDATWLPPKGSSPPLPELIKKPVPSAIKSTNSHENISSHESYHDSASDVNQNEKVTPIWIIGVIVLSLTAFFGTGFWFLRKK